MSLMVPTDGPNAGFTMLLFQIAAIGAVFYFFIIRPQQQARRKHEGLLQALKKGDDITTAGGIIGRVKEIKDNRITIESAGSTLLVERSRIVRVGDQSAPGVAG